MTFSIWIYVYSYMNLCFAPFYCGIFYVQILPVHKYSVLSKFILVHIAYFTISNYSSYIPYPASLVRKLFDHPHVTLMNATRYLVSTFPVFHNKKWRYDASVFAFVECIIIVNLFPNFCSVAVFATSL